MKKCNDQFYTPTEVAKILKLDVRTVRQMINPSNKRKKAVIKAVNISTGSKKPIWRVPANALERFISSRNK